MIRGPGGSLWGANAVNGVINITTRSAKETQGGAYFEGGAGNVERGFGAVRYGGQLAPRGPPPVSFCETGRALRVHSLKSLVKLDRLKREPCEPDPSHPGR